MFVVVLLSRLSLSMLRRLFPASRPVIAVSGTPGGIDPPYPDLYVLIVIGPMIVFYVVEDWVLFSLGLLLLIGAALTVRQTLPRYWHQMQIFLNIGAVREGSSCTLTVFPGWSGRSISSARSTTRSRNSASVCISRTWSN